MSFDSPWRWTDGQLAGFRDGLAPLDADIRVFQMDVKRHASAQAKAERGRLARAVIDEWKPDLIYTSDDDALGQIGSHYGDGPIPLVFSGANRTLAEHGLEGARAITGVLEREHFVESVKLLRTLVPEAHRLAVLGDRAPHWPAVLARMRAGLPALPGIELARVEFTEHYDRFRTAVVECESQVDAIVYLGIFNLRGGDGSNMPYQTVQRWVADNSRRPDLSFWIDRVHHGVLCSVTVSEREQGLAAGRLARAILGERRSPAELPVRPTVKGLPAINLARARQLGLTVRSSELLSSEVVPTFQWQRD
ncbi:ABC transporter substrate-binding protein [Methyloversatilis thermotolerans]|uniref:ABC transporter substrate-binding protein n=1 Tax=Methyloversatilis thermotolerans TaxID=1346290 RepID=UPI000372867B|nr:ABC transporter substrate binding protein [Methyloversatilis thermotolerans]